jgi:hypothetical protein
MDAAEMRIQQHDIRKMRRIRRAFAGDRGVHKAAHLLKISATALVTVG